MWLLGDHLRIKTSPLPDDAVIHWLGRFQKNNLSPMLSLLQTRLRKPILSQQMVMEYEALMQKAEMNADWDKLGVGDDEEVA